MTDAKTNKVKYGINSGVLVLTVAGILVAANVIGTRLFARMDLTDSKEFTISDATKNVLGNLDDVVLAKVYFSKNLPDQLATLERNVRDQLREYEIYGKGNLQIQFINPDEDEEIKNQAIAMGVPQIQMNVLDKDQYQIINVFMGIGLQSGEKTDALPVIEDLSTFEYDFTAAIIKLTRSKDYTVGVLQGSGERDLTTELTGLNRLLAERFTVRPVDLRGGAAAVPDDIDVLLVPGPKNVVDRAKYELDQYVMRGGKVMFLIDVMALNEGMGLQALPARSGLEDMLTHYGAEISNELVQEYPRYAAQAQFSQGYISYLVPYPLWPKTSKGLFNPDNPITSRLESLVLPWTAPVELTVPGDEIAKQERADKGQPEPEWETHGVEGSVLVRTTERAWTQSGRFDLNPQAAAVKNPPETGQSYPLAVALTGTFQSFYDGKPAPSKPGEEADGTMAADSTIAASPQTQMLVVGDSNFLTDQFLRMFPDNSLFVQNALDWMTLGEDLIAIRSRGATARPLKEISAGARDGIRWINTLGIPILVILFGFIWNGARKKARQRLAERYAA
ncbi:MAG: Gldg family protein [Candidatus Eisenbacteria bacterium]|uniref:GldG family protein n=1 Tax=Eiseniibacteriota bacterium TaxID=2212470 RepID=A0A956M0D8_UNCEI|nr:GldG family protein [Candidatus Eisenbacteria bacterium]